MSRIEDPSTVADGGVEVGGVFVRRVLVRLALVGLVAFFVVGLLAPWSLMLEAPGLFELWRVCLFVGVAAVGLAVASAWPRMRRARRVFRSLAFEPESVSPEDVGSLAAIPFALTTRFVVAGAIAAALIGVPGIRPQGLDDARAVNLALLTFTIVAASAVVQYVALRDATIRAIELSPLGPITAWLEREAMRLGPRQRVTRKILLAVVAPVALVGVGAVLVAQAQIRAFVEQSRGRTATAIVDIALTPIPGEVGVAGREDAVAAAAAQGFFLQKSRDELPEGGKPRERLGSGQVRAYVALEEGHASVRYSAELPSNVVTISVWLALFAVLVAAMTGGIFGRLLATDLALATQQVSSLGTDMARRGMAKVAGPARFRVVADLGRSVEALAERFRTFAAAQERALEARASAQRMKQLLFASVSHDLKSPLNAILGFAELVRDEPLTQAQLESLDMVSGRGRELMALIETILDAARVEAGQLSLLPRAMKPDHLVQDAVIKARDLHGPKAVELSVEVPTELPRIEIDPTYGARAVAVLVAHAMDTASTVHSRRVRVRASRPSEASDAEGPEMVRLHIEYVAASNTPSLLEAQLQGKLHKQTGRGKVLRLSLARSIIELHRGRVEVGRGSHGAAVVTCWLPIAGEDVPFADEDPDTLEATTMPIVPVEVPTVPRHRLRELDAPTVRIIDREGEEVEGPTLVFEDPRKR